MCWVFADSNKKVLSGWTPQYVDEIWLSADSRHVTQIKRAQVRFPALSPWLRGLDLNQRPSGHEPERSILSLADSVALTLATGLKTLYSRPILCPRFAQVSPDHRRCRAESIHYIRPVRRGEKPHSDNPRSLTTPNVYATSRPHVET